MKLCTFGVLLRVISSVGSERCLDRAEVSSSSLLSPTFHNLSSVPVQRYFKRPGKNSREPPLPADIFLHADTHQRFPGRLIIIHWVSLIMHLINRKSNPAIIVKRNTIDRVLLSNLLPD